MTTRPAYEHRATAPLSSIDTYRCGFRPGFCPPSSVHLQTACTKRRPAAPSSGVCWIRGIASAWQSSHNAAHPRHHSWPVSPHWAERSSRAICRHRTYLYMDGSCRFHYIATATIVLRSGVQPRIELATSRTSPE